MTYKNGLFISSIIYVISSLIILSAIIYIIDNMDYIVRRDPMNYWDRSYELYRIIDDHGLHRWAKKVLFSIQNNHTYFPSAIPSLIFYILSNDNISVYGSSLVLLYLAPIPALAVWLPPHPASPAEAFAKAIVMLSLAYPFIAHLMPTTPDFGGNLFITAAMVTVGMIFGRLDQAMTPKSFLGICLLIFASVLFLFLSVVFRRWFAFVALPLLLAYSVSLVLASARLDFRRGIFMAGALATTGMVFALLLLPLLAGKIATVSSGGIFSGAYDAYRQNYLLTFKRFGLAELISFAALMLVAAAVPTRNAAALLYPTLLGTVAGAGFFLYIQAPGIHHFSILWPGIAVAASSLLGHLRGFRAAGLLLVTAASMALIGAHFPLDPMVDRHGRAYRLLADKIRQHEMVDREFCVLGSRDVYTSVVNNLWQVTDEGKRGSLPQALRIPEMDFGLAERYASGALVPALKRCRWIITTEELVLDKMPQFQRILRYHHERVFDSESDVGRAYTIIDRFSTSFRSPVIIFERKQGVSINGAALKEDYLRWLADDIRSNP